MRKPRLTVILAGTLLGVTVALISCIVQFKMEKESLETQLAEYKADELEIYPCPFCGSEDVSVVDMWGDGRTCYVLCNDCHGSGSMENPNTGDDNMSKAKAIEWWNHNARE